MNRRLSFIGNDDLSFCKEIDDRNSAYSVSEFAAVLYLSLPLFLFCFSFLLPALSVVCCLGIAFSVYRCTKTVSWSPAGIAAPLILAVVAVAWLLSAGLTNLTIQGSDWRKHYAVLNALMDDPWPAVRPTGLYLRYGLGFYMVPAILGKIIGVQAAIAAWTWIGLFLSLRLINDYVGFAWRHAVVVALVVVFFSGLDYIGILTTGEKLRGSWHFEWWAIFGQISSITTTLSWAPQHAVAVLLGSSLFLRNARTSRFDSLIFASIIFWSPLTAVGMSPFFAWRWIRKDFLKEIVNVENLCVYPVIVVLGLYFSKDTGSLPSGLVWSFPAFTLKNFMLVILLEWGLISAALLYCDKTVDRWMLLIVAVSLTVFPTYLLGGANDFMMRTTAPAIAVLAALCARAIGTQPAGRAIPLIILLTIGAVTPIGEFGRIFSGPPPDLSKTTLEEVAVDDHIPQYLSSRPSVLRYAKPN